MKTLRKLYRELRKRRSKFLYKPNMLFREGDRIIAVVIIKSYLLSPPKLVLLQGNWPILSIYEGEINETSNHSLIEKLKRVGVLTFNAYGDSMMIEPLKKPRETIEKVVKMLFEKAKREDKATELIKGHFLSVK